MGMDFNINRNVFVKLTDEGRRILRQAHDDLHAHIRSVSPMPTNPSEYRPPEEDEDGWSKWQLWELMASFGAHICNGCKPPFELTIRIPDDG
jgi:DNA-binding MarR family transcriptional regulator